MSYLDDAAQAIGQAARRSDLSHTIVYVADELRNTIPILVGAGNAVAAEFQPRIEEISELTGTLEDYAARLTRGE